MCIGNIKTAAMTLLLVLCVACEHDQTVSLSGEVVYANYEQGSIVIEACQSESSSRAGLGSVSITHPGKCVAKKVLSGPGKFSFKAEMTWVDMEPEIDLIFYLVPDANDNFSACIAGGALYLPLQDHKNLLLNLEDGNCPARM